MSEKAKVSVIIPLYRGKDSIFLSRDGRWYVRSSPENNESSPRAETVS